MNPITRAIVESFRWPANLGILSVLIYNAFWLFPVYIHLLKNWRYGVTAQIEYFLDGFIRHHEKLSGMAGNCYSNSRK